MKKLKALLLVAACVLGMAGCDNKTVNLDFPFEADEVVSVDMYRYVGAPVSAEKKVIVAEETIKSLYNKLESISYEIKDVEETTGASVTSFRFNLSDGTNYELIYGCYGVKNGNLKSPTGNFEYFTSADIGWNWEFLDSELEAVAAEESELPGITPIQQTESKPTVTEVASNIHIDPDGWGEVVDDDAVDYSANDIVTDTTAPHLTMRTLKALVDRYGEDLTWDTFDTYYSEEVTSGLYTLSYPVDTDYHLLIIGDIDKTPTSILLTSANSDSVIDIRTNSIDDFINGE